MCLFPDNCSKQGTCIPSPSPRLIGFPVTIILHFPYGQLEGSKKLFLQIYHFYPVVNVQPTTSSPFLTTTAYLSTGSLGSISPYSSSFKIGVHKFLYTWYPLTKEGTSISVTTTIWISSSSFRRRDAIRYF